MVDLAVIDGQLISSSLIRQCLRDGKVALAARYLSRPHRIRGTVSKGAGRGATIGFPTINLADTDTLVPGDGVYAGLASLGGDERPIPAACNIGPNPTFGEQSRKIEAHLIGFSGDLYGTARRARFPGAAPAHPQVRRRDELVAQIQRDIDQARSTCDRSQQHDRETEPRPTEEPRARL